MRNTGTVTVTTPTDCEVVLTRVFDAPRHLVYAALTTPDLLARWFGPRGWALTVCELDHRVGGSWRFVLRGPDGAQMGMRGRIHEIDPPGRMVHSESFDDFADAGESVVTTVLVEQAGTTTMTVTVRYPSREIRDAVVSSGMEHGAAESYDKLAEVLATRSDRETIAGRYRLRADAFEAKIQATRPDQWSAQSPCAEWKARDVVEHIVVMHGVMLRPLGRQLSAAPAVADDPLAAFLAARADVEAILRDPAVANTEHDWYTGRMTVAETIDQVVSADMVIHGWDLARATGQDATIDPAEIQAAQSNMAPLDDAILRQPGVLGPALDPPPGADAQTRFLAFLGRQAW